MANECPQENEEYKRQIYSHDNHVYFVGNINVHNGTELLLAIRKARDESPTSSSAVSDVYLHITSEGGDYQAATMLFDQLCAMAQEGINLITIATGFVFSAGSLVFLAGNTRVIGPSTVMLLHQLSSTFQGGTFQEVKAEYENTKTLMSIIQNIYVSRTRLSKKMLSQYLKKDVMINANDCVKHNIAHCLMGTFRLGP